MKRKMTIGLVIIALMTTLLWAGSLNPPAPPTAGTMKPLNDVEPRIAIHQSDIPMTISASGSYYLAENVTVSGNNEGITVNVNNVTIDLSGFTMTGSDGTSSYGIYMNGRDNVEIRNGTIRDFNVGILGTTLEGKNHRILGVRILSCTASGIHLAGDNCQIRDCTIADGGTETGYSGTAYGITINRNSIVSGNTIYNHGISTDLRVFCIDTGSGCKIADNTIYANGTSATGDYVVGIWSGYGCTVSGNSVYENGDTSSSPIVYGIYVGSGSVVTGNTSYGNGTSAGGPVYGINSSSGCMVVNNTAYDNGDSAGNNVYGINASNGCTVTGNTAYSNGSSSTGVNVYGIYVGSGGSVTNNTSRSNGNSASGTVYGIYLGGYNLVNNNTAYLNSGTAGGTNMNTVASCTYGTNCAP